MGDYTQKQITFFYKKLEQPLGDLMMLAAENPQGSSFTPARKMRIGMGAVTLAQHHIMLRQTSSDYS